MIAPSQPSLSADARALFRLDGKVCLVTGGVGEVSGAISTALAQARGHVCILGRPGAEAAATALAQSLTDRGLSAEAAGCGFSAAEVDAVIADLAKRHGKLNVMVSGGEVALPRLAQESESGDDGDAAQSAVATTAAWVEAAQDLLRAAVQVDGDASIVLVASIYGMVSPDPRLHGLAGGTARDGAAAAALLQYTRHAAVHLAPRAIRVNSISVGVIAPASPRQASGGLPSTLAEKIPLGRSGRPEDVAGAVVFLASAASRFVTGANLPVDGGWTAC